MKKIIIVLLTILICLSLTACSSAKEETTSNDIQTEEATKVIEENVVYKSNMTVDKAETVNIKTDANGVPYETEVEVDLKNPLDNESIKDKTNLTNIINTDGDEEYSADGDYIYWDNKGQDIHYKGYSDETLPVSVNIHYYLDDKEITPEELAHKSGHVKMRFDYVNNTSVTSKVNGINYNVKIPFVCLTMLYLSNDNFYNIESEDGQIMSMDDSTLIIGTGFPGLKDSLKLGGTDFTKDIDIKEYFEIEADVVDFELDYTATLVSNGLLEDLEDKDLKDIDDMLDEVDDIDDQKKDIEDSKDELEDASDEFSSLVDKLAGYVTSLNGYVTRMNANSTETLKALTIKMTDLNKTIDDTKNADPSYEYVFNMETDATAYANKKKDEIDYYKNIIATTNDNDIKKSAEAALEIANFYYEYRELTVYSTSFASKFDTSEVKDSIDDAFDDLIDVLDEFEDNIDELTEDIDSGLRETVNRLKASRNVDKAYDNFSGIVDDKESSVVFIIQSDEIK